MPADVTVVIPTHNRLHLLPGAISSVLGQRDVSVQVVVVNDGSADGTKPWLDRLAAQDCRIKVVHHDRPLRMSSARNAGIARATARWVAFCDDDDLWAPDKLAAQLSALTAESARWGCTGGVLVDEDLRILGHHRVRGGNVLLDLTSRNVIPSGGSSVIAEARLLRDVGGFDPALPGSEDWDLWIRLARHSPVAAVDRPMIAYRQGRATASTNVDIMRKGREIIFARYGAPADEREAKAAEAMHERYLAKQLLRAGRGRKAASILASLVLKHQQWRELPRAAAALVAPRITDRIGSARAAAVVPNDWRMNADAWLEPVRQAKKPLPLLGGVVCGLTAALCNLILKAHSSTFATSSIILCTA